MALSVTLTPLLEAGERVCLIARHQQHAMPIFLRCSFADRRLSGTLPIWQRLAVYVVQHGAAYRSVDPLTRHVCFASLPRIPSSPAK
jgi:hypothetical protein